jgi:hypothetical protein
MRTYPGGPKHKDPMDPDPDPDPEHWFFDKKCFKVEAHLLLWLMNLCKPRRKMCSLR